VTVEVKVAVSFWQKVPLPEIVIVASSTTFIVLEEVASV